MQLAKYQYQLEGLSCANCAAKIEAQVAKLHGVSSATVDFVGKSLTVRGELDEAEVRHQAVAIIRAIEPSVKLQIKDADHTAHVSDEKDAIKWKVISLACSIGLFILSFLFEHVWHLAYAPAIGFGIATVLAGYRVFIQGVRSLLHFRLDENTLMSIAVIAAFCLGEFSEAAMVSILFYLGEMLENKAVSRSRRDIERLAEIRPDTAHLIIQDGPVQVGVDGETCHCTDHDHHMHPEGAVQTHDDCCADSCQAHQHGQPESAAGEKVVPAASVSIGDMIAVYPYERIPLDGQVVSGTSSLDASALTGESLPLEAAEGTEVMSGMMNGQGLLTIQVTNDFENSAATRILGMVEESAARKGHAEKLITRFATIYTPIVIGLAVLLMAIPPLIGLGDFTVWFSRALVFLVASCPCALVISVPLGFFSGIGAASKNGVLVKGGKYIEVLSHPGAVVFDKTGTLTSGKLEVSELVPTDDWDLPTLLQYAASAEQYSAHPAAQAIIAANQQPLLEAADPREMAGQGVAAMIDGRQVLCGRKRLMETYQIDVGSKEASIYIAVDGKLAGWIQLADRPRDESQDCIRRLRDQGVRRIVMLTGDGESAAARVSGELGGIEYHAGLLPEDKVFWMEKIRGESGKTIFVGDGINDAPVLAAADCGVAMGLGTDAAIEASDVVLTAGNPAKLADAVSLSMRSMRVIRFNIAFALIIKAAVLLLAAIGLAPMWLAVFADVGVSIIAVMNATRILRFKAK